MSLAEFQHALSNLVMSPPFRAQVAESPDSALAGFDLSGRERERLAALAQDSRMRMGTLIHRSFRLSMLSNTLPRTCKALGPQGVKDLVHAYWQEHLPRSLLYNKEGRRFGEYALERMRRGEFCNDFLPEVLEAEMGLLELSRQELWETPPDGSSETGGGRDGRVPRLHPFCRVVRFRRDPQVVLDELKEGRIPEGLPEGEHYLLLCSPDIGQVVVQPLSVERGRALLACSMGEEADPRDLPEGDLLRELAEAGYLLCEVEEDLPDESSTLLVSCTLDSP